MGTDLRTSHSDPAAFHRRQPSGGRLRQLFGFAVMVAMTYWMFQRAASFDFQHRSTVIFVLSIGVLVYWAYTIVLPDRRPVMIVEKEGISFPSQQIGRIPWSNVSHVERKVRWIFTNQYENLVFDFTPGTLPPGRYGFRAADRCEVHVRSMAFLGLLNTDTIEPPLPEAKSSLERFVPVYQPPRAFRSAAN